MQLFIGTTCYTSLIFKKAPGTISSFAIFLLLFFVPISLEYKLIGIFFLGFCHYFCFPYFQTRYGTDDPAPYTLDETFAMALLSIPFYSRGEWVAAFFIFRFFDIVKPLGIKKIEHSKRMPSIIRNILDDIIAAAYTFLVIMGYKYVF